MIPETEFAALVDACTGAPDARERLTALLREDRTEYEQRGGATIVRMRGWVLVALARAGVSEEALPFVLEELDNGADPYLVAAAARALRSYTRPNAALAPFVMRAIGNIRYHDDPVSFDRCGEYASTSTAVTPVRELLATLVWLGPYAKAVAPELQTLRSGLPSRMRPAVDRALEAIGGGGAGDACCLLPLRWTPAQRRGSTAVDAIVFEDQAGDTIQFREFFRGRPSVVVFFYTRCDNPLKCSLSVTRLARVQQILEARDLGGTIRTAAITYDPGFDSPERLRCYGEGRGIRFGPDNRMLRTTDGFSALRSHFGLGVNFVESLVNRHRIELFILDPDGRIAARFERIRWDEEQVADAAAGLLKEEVPRRAPAVSGMFGTLAGLAIALIPKCPVCWAAYLSTLGIGAQMAYAPALRSLLIALLLIGAASTWFRGRRTGRMGGAFLAAAGAVAILASQISPDWKGAALLGVVLTAAGSVWSVVDRRLPLSEEGRGRSTAIQSGLPTGTQGRP